MKKQIFIVGAGGHAKVVTETISDSQEWEITAYLDENFKEQKFLGKPVLNSMENFKAQFPSVKTGFVAIGQNSARKMWHNILAKNGYTVPWLKHTTAFLSPSAQIGAGSLLTAKTFVGADAKVGNGVIVNTGAILDHDSSVGDFSHISQGAIACGGAQIGSEVLVGPGCIVEKSTRIPSGATTPSNGVVAAQ